MAAVAAALAPDDTQIRLPIGAIECFEGNPRLVANPEYERIKASIRESGLQQPLVITRAPNAEHYTVEAGGNTRLRILQELFRETGDNRFGEVDCVLRPWISYDHVVIAHLKENDLRGNLTFVEKALAICAIETRLNEEAAKRRTKPLPQRAVADRLAREGFAIDQSQLSVMRYAVDRLYPVMGAALRDGMGRPSIVGLKRLDAVAASLWEAWELGKEGAYDPIFLTLCERYEPDFDLAEFRKSLEYEIAQCAGVLLETVKLIVASMLEGDPAPPKPKPEDYPDSVENAKDEEGEGKDKKADEDKDEEPAADDESEGPDHAPFHTHGDFATPGLESLRANAYQTAHALAEAFGLEAVITATPDRGVGYLVTEFPDPELMDHCSLEEQTAISFLWWHLVALAEVTVMPVEITQAVLPADSRLRAALASDEPGALFDGIRSVDLGQVAHRFWNVLDAEQWGLLIDLQEIYRTLRSCFSPESPLWRLEP